MLCCFGYGDHKLELHRFVLCKGIMCFLYPPRHEVSLSSLGGLSSTKYFNSTDLPSMQVVRIWDKVTRAREMTQTQKEVTGTQEEVIKLQVEAMGPHVKAMELQVEDTGPQEVLLTTSTPYELIEQSLCLIVLLKKEVQRVSGLCILTMCYM